MEHHCRVDHTFTAETCKLHGQPPGRPRKTPRIPGASGRQVGFCPFPWLSVVHRRGPRGGRVRSLSPRAPPATAQRGTRQRLYMLSRASTARQAMSKAPRPLRGMGKLRADSAWTHETWACGRARRQAATHFLAFLLGGLSPPRLPYSRVDAVRPSADGSTHSPASLPSIMPLAVI